MAWDAVIDGACKAILIVGTVAAFLLFAHMEWQDMMMGVI